MNLMEKNHCKIWCCYEIQIGIIVKVQILSMLCINSENSASLEYVAVREHYWHYI